MTIAYPSIHLNGDTVDTLLDNAMSRIEALQGTIKIFRETYPHPRNYPGIAIKDWDNVQASHYNDLKILNVLLEETERMAEYLADEKLKRLKPGSAL